MFDYAWAATFSDFVSTQNDWGPWGLDSKIVWKHTGCLRNIFGIKHTFFRGTTCVWLHIWKAQWTWDSNCWKIYVLKMSSFNSLKIRAFQEQFSLKLEFCRYEHFFQWPTFFLMHLWRFDIYEQILWLRKISFSFRRRTIKN